MLYIIENNIDINNFINTGNDYYDKIYNDKINILNKCKVNTIEDEIKIICFNYYNILKNITNDDEYIENYIKKKLMLNPEIKDYIEKKEKELSL